MDKKQYIKKYVRLYRLRFIITVAIMIVFYLIVAIGGYFALPYKWAIFSIVAYPFLAMTLLIIVGYDLKGSIIYFE